MHYSGYSTLEIRPVVRLMIDYLARKEILHDAFFKKYAAKKSCFTVRNDCIYIANYVPELVTAITLIRKPP